MEVSCQRCQTEYDFDDALIAEKGTSVRCTTCGFEFKVFPAPGSARQKFVVLTEDGEEQPFGSLGELQRAIARGVVRENDLLRRGDGEPRPLGSIAELVPLLRQSRSVPPPSLGSEPPSAVGRESRTRLGLPSLADVERARASVAAPPESSAPGEERPRIQSPLSQRSLSPGALADLEALSGPPPSPRGKLPSLSDTLLGRPSRAPEPREAFDSSSDVSADERRASSTPPPLPVFSAPSVRPVAPAPEEFRAPSLPASPEAEPVEPSGRPSVQSVSDWGEARSTPASVPGRRATGSLPGRPRARLAPVVLAACVGVGGYSLYGRFVNRSVREAAPVPEAARGSVSPERVRELDVEAFRLRLLGKSETEVRERALALLTEAGAGEWTTRVDLLRLAGRVDEARRLLAERAARSTGTSVERQYPLALALLDVADSTAEPPWSVVVERFEEAARGETAPYFASAARVWALVEGERLEEAKTALLELERMPEVAASPLLAPLVVFVRRAEEKGPTTPPSRTVELPPVGISTAEAALPPPQAVGPEVKKLAAEADAHWSAGEREPAVELYRKVFRKVGPEHFLGQKAMARIKQAERELSSSGNPP